MDSVHQKRGRKQGSPADSKEQRKDGSGGGSLGPLGLHPGYHPSHAYGSFTMHQPAMHFHMGSGGGQPPPAHAAVSQSDTQQQLGSSHGGLLQPQQFMPSPVPGRFQSMSSMAGPPHLALQQQSPALQQPAAGSQSAAPPSGPPQPQSVHSSGAGSVSLMYSGPAGHALSYAPLQGGQYPPQYAVYGNSYMHPQHAHAAQSAFAAGRSPGDHPPAAGSAPPAAAGSSAGLGDLGALGRPVNSPAKPPPQPQRPPAGAGPLSYPPPYASYGYPPPSLQQSGHGGPTMPFVPPPAGLQYGHMYVHHPLAMQRPPVVSPPMYAMQQQQQRPHFLHPTAGGLAAPGPPSAIPSSGPVGHPSALPPASHPLTLSTPLTQPPPPQHTPHTAWYTQQQQLQQQQQTQQLMEQHAHSSLPPSSQPHS